MVIKVEQRRQRARGTGALSRVGQHRVGVAQLIKMVVSHGVNGGQPFGWRVLKKLADKINSRAVSPPEDLGERVGLDLRETVFHVVRVHGANLFLGRRAEHFDDLNELVDTRIAGKQRLA